MSRSDRKLRNVHRRAVLKGLLIGGASVVPLAGYALRTSLGPDRHGMNDLARGEELRRGQTPGPAPVSQRRLRPSGTQPPWDVLAPLRVGTYVGSGWRVKALSAVKRGAAVLTLAHLTGEVAEVHVCRRSGLPRGLAHTAHLDLYLMNDGDGDLPTPEGVGRAVKTIALRITRRERADLGGAQAPHAMMSHWARVRWYGTPEGAA
ncbi:MAG: hypothetical protein JRI23_15500 [Deltaproteobacteria bacterium]|jgi:hypothetical protein|nr:hypothetical protein [Deltaproteobacteria bacterium]MBW2533158.1 hypothetical protein [Deltaproteobacteria bacterium]